MGCCIIREAKSPCGSKFNQTLALPPLTAGSLTLGSMINSFDRNIMNTQWLMRNLQSDLNRDGLITQLTSHS
jgi:hypothetical protein